MRGKPARRAGLLRIPFLVARSAIKKGIILILWKLFW
jgi:hypothetical protein